MKKALATITIWLLFVPLVFSQIPTDGLVGYWSFTGNANDESSNDNHGTVDGAILTTDRFGNENYAYHFSGPDKIETNFQGVLGQNDRTISFWVKIQPDEKGGFILSYGGGYGTSFTPAIFYDETNHPSNHSIAHLDISDATVSYDSDINNDGNWHHYTYIFSTQYGTVIGK